MKIGRRERVEAKIVLLSVDTPQYGIVNFVVKNPSEKRYAKFFLQENGLCKAPLEELEKAFEENRIITLILYRIDRVDYIARVE